ncbi:hypothetical protein ACDF64_03180 [Agromyces sp. MMS24-JH15]|uniref:hypothetical protein n=1 Tax=Agromyces sp. MMS24-JH15 TaxID=3243765 RepID=UPI00374A7D10
MLWTRDPATGGENLPVQLADSEEVESAATPEEATVRVRMTKSHPGRRLACALAASAAMLALAGCSTGISEYEMAQGEYEEHLENGYEPTEEQLQAEGEAAYEQSMAETARWSCYYDPTMNENWHDDVLCTNGMASDRPVLLPDDSFIEYEEIMQAAAEYEAALNG